MDRLATEFIKSGSLREKIGRVAKSRYFLAMKWLVVIGALGLLINVVSYEELVASLSQIPPATLISFLAIFFLSKAIYAGRWRLICRHVVPLPPVTYGYLLRVHLLGELGAIIFCSSGAGEVVRISKLANKTGAVSLAALSVALDRLFSVIGMMLLALAFLPHLSISAREIMPVADGVGWMIFGLMAGLCALGLWFGLKKGVALGRQHHLNFASPMMFKLLLLTMVSHLLFATSYCLLIQKVYPSPYLDLMALFFVAQLGKIVPVSVLGVSGGEASLVALAYLAGIPSEAILVVVGVAVSCLYLISFGSLLVELAVDGRAFLRNIYYRSH